MTRAGLSDMACPLQTQSSTPNGATIVLAAATVGKVENRTQPIATDASAGRVSAATVGGKPAVLVAPIAPDGLGPSAVIMAEDFGITIVSADGLPLEETMKIAEGLK